MRRWLCLFLLVCLPLQLSWAVAASYCQHEQGPDVQHYGHHEHRHHHEHTVPGDAGLAGELAQADQAGQPSDASHDAHAGKPLGAADSDCAACHLGALQPLPLALSAPLAEHLHALVPHTVRGHTSHIPEGLERPDIVLAA